MCRVNQQAALVLLQEPRFNCSLFGADYAQGSASVLPPKQPLESSKLAHSTRDIPIAIMATQTI